MGNPLASLVAGFFAGIAEVLVGYPFDTIKTRLQTYGTGEHGECLDIDGAWRCCKSTYKLEGIGGFYKGILPLMIQDALGISLLFGARDWMQKNVGADITRPGLFLLSCCLIGLMEAVVYCPLDHLKARMQVKNWGIDRLPLSGKLNRSPPPEVTPTKSRQSNGTVGNETNTQGRSVTSSRSRPPANSSEGIDSKDQQNGRHSRGNYSGGLQEASGGGVVAPGGFWGALLELFACAWTVIRSRGISGLYLGFYLQAMKEMVGNIALFGTYDTITLLGQGMESSGRSWIAIWPAGSLAGIAYYLLSFPFDTMKSKLQTDSLISPRYRSSFHCFLKVLEECSLWELYQGVSMCLLRAIPGGAVEFFVFELVFFILGSGVGSFSLPSFSIKPIFSRVESLFSSQADSSEFRVR